MARPVTLGG